MGNIDLKYMFTSPDGRIGRQTWWIGVAILFVVSLLLGALFGQGGIIPLIINVLMLIAGLMLHIKRCHDRGKSGWWCLLLLIPLVGLVWAVIDLGILEGERTANRYGPPPSGVAATP
jgi:uncharacterized membrane protein YhaH (DUF805 family)